MSGWTKSQIIFMNETDSHVSVSWLNQSTPLNNHRLNMYLKKKTIRKTQTDPIAVSVPVNSKT